MGVTRGSLYGEDPTSDIEEGNIKSPSSQIEDEDVSFRCCFGVKTVGNCGSGGFIDDTQNLETSDGTGVFGSQTLGVIEVGGHAKS